MNTLKVYIWVAILAMAVLCETVVADPLPSIRAEVATIVESSAALKRQLPEDASMRTRGRIVQRLNDAQVFYLNQQFSRAGIVLLDLIERRGIERHAAYSDILYYLGDSLFQLGNDETALTHLTRLKQVGSKDRREWAMGRILQICGRANSLDGCGQNRTDAVRSIQAGSLSSLKYALAKALHTDGQYRQSRSVFKLLKSTDPEWSKGLYFIGVSFIQDNQLDEARKSFVTVVEQLAQLSGTSPEQKQLLNLSRLAVARIDYENDRLDDALDMYNQVERGSSAFDDAIHESIWVSIKRGEYRESIRQLELMMIRYSNVAAAHKSHLLKGRLLILLDEYKLAQQSFAELTEAFIPIKEELEQTLNAHPDLEAYFQRRIGKDLGDLDVSQLVPKRALDASGTKLETNDALMLVSEVNTQRRDVESAKRTISKVKNALSSRMRLELFPQLKTGYEGALELLNRALLAESELNDWVGDRVDDTKYQRVRTERRQLAALFKQVPKTAIDMQNRRQRVGEELRKLDEMANRLNAEMTALDAQLTAIKNFRRGTQNSGLSAADLDAELARTEQLRAELRKLTWELEDEKSRIGSADYADRRDMEIRDAFAAALRAESKQLNVLKPRHVELRQSLIDASGVLETYLTAVAERVRTAVRTMLTQIEDEQRSLELYERELKERERETSLLGGAIAAATYRDVYQTIRRVVLAADVGLVNMAWRRKRQKTQSIKTMTESKNRDIGQIEEIFGEVVGE